MSESPSLPRAKRQKLDRNGRGAAFERLKQLKGSKNKYVVKDDVDNIYDTLDEKEYAKMVLKRQAEDWIEDDGGCGYIEDGREIFDDDELEPLPKNKGKGSESRKRSRVSDNSKGSIRNLLGNMVPKKKETAVKLEEDNILADILGEIDSGSSSGNIKKTKAVVDLSQNMSDINESEAAKNYMKNFGKKSHSGVVKNVLTTAAAQVKCDEDDNAILNKMIPTASKKPFPRETKLENKENVLKENAEAAPVQQKAIVCEIDADYMNDLDFSVLDEAENQFQQEIIMQESEVVQNKCITEETSQKVVDAVTEEHLLAGWQTVSGNESLMEQVVEETVNVKDITGKTIRVWWWDAWEDPYKRPGEVFLFGKVAQPNKNDNAQNLASLTSCCIKITNIERVLFLLPREYALDPITFESTDKKVSMLDVYEEFNTTVAPKLGLSAFRTRKVTKNYAFGLPGVPSVSEYLEVRYESNKPAPKKDDKYVTIAHVFGATTTPLEAFLLDRKIKGPCWLDINNAKVEEDKPLSWCKLEIVCPSPKNVIPNLDRATAVPPIVVCTLNVKCSFNPKTASNEVALISVLVHKSFPVDKTAPNPPFQQHFCGITRPSNCIFPLDLASKLSSYKSTKTYKQDSERALLSWFMTMFSMIDADLVVTHDALDCQLELLCHRIASLKLPNWSKTGRLRMSSNFGKKAKDWFIGRMICDVKLSAEELIKSKSYDLDTLCVNVLKIKEGERIDVSSEELNKMYESSDSLLKLISLTMQDASYVIRLMCELNVLPLALQITNIAGNLMSRTLQGGRSERNEFLLLHAFTERNYIVPDKKVREWSREGDNSETTLKQVGRKKPAYSGGLVLEPKKGFYDKLVLLMDFNSLYPSIIQEYNICFTTVQPPEDDLENIILPDKSIELGVLPTQIRILVNSRREVKKLMSSPDISPDLKMQYNIRQMALKLTANSMYGCLGFSHSRFFAQHLAALVTQKGRDILINTRELVQKLQYDVIYGDTDSIMINTNSLDYDQVFKIGSSIKQAVNKIYKQIELDIDGVFRYLLLLKKKKYAAVTISKNKNGEFTMVQELKGLDIVRRDWSQISVMAGRVILDEILSDIQSDERIENIHKHLEKFKENIEHSAVPLLLLTITKQLTKAPMEYANPQNLPHVQVAIRMNATHNKRYKKGDMVPYIICEDGTENAATQRAYHVDELKASDGKLKIDIKYYLAQQIHPVVTRLCEPIEGTDASRIAGCLGLDPAAFKVAAAKVQRERDESGVGEKILTSTYEKYSMSEKFSFKCISCKTVNQVASAFKRIESSLIPVLEKCANVDCKVAPFEYLHYIQNMLSLRIKEFIRKFYDNWMICDEPSCSRSTRIMSHFLRRGRPACLACGKGGLQRQYTERELYMQLNYFQYVFDLHKHDLKSIRISPQAEDAYYILKETVDRVLTNSGYSIVKLSQIFSQLHPESFADRHLANMELVRDE